jgi:hypothetical protein
MAGNFIFIHFLFCVFCLFFVCLLCAVRERDRQPTERAKQYESFKDHFV